MLITDNACSPINLLHIFRTPFHKNSFSYHSHEAARRMSQKKSVIKGNSKAAGCMATNLLKTDFFTCIIKMFY